jgi:flagellar protein FlbD
MIEVTRFDGTSMLVNGDLIQTIEHTPDTVVSLVNGEKLLVRESPAEVRRRFVDYKREVMAGAPVLACRAEAA